MRTAYSSRTRTALSLGLIAGVFLCAAVPALAAAPTPYLDPDPAAVAPQRIDATSPQWLGTLEAIQDEPPPSPLPDVGFGFTEAMAGRADSARASYARALELAANDHQTRHVRWSYGWALLYLKRPDEAIAQWRLAADLHGGKPFWVPYSLAIAHWMAGRHDEALQWYAQAVASNPERWGTEPGVAQATRFYRPHERAAMDAIFAAWQKKRGQGSRAAR